MNYFRCGGGRSTHTASQITVAKTPLATFESNVSGLYIPEILAYFTASQSGSGGPSPSNPRTISGVSSIDTTVCGKNLFNKNATGLISNKYVAQDGTETTNSYFSISDYIKISGSEITVSGSTNSGNAPSVCFYDGAKSFISGIKHSNYSFPHTYTVPTGAVYLRESVSNPDIDTFQLELGSTDTAFEAYRGATATTALGGTYYGGTLNLQTGLLTITRIYYNMADLSYTTTSWGAYRSATLSDDIKYSAPSEAMCDIYNFVSYSTLNQQKPNNSFALSSNYIYVLADTSPVGNVCYNLLTPRTIQLTPAQLEQLLGQNNVFCSSGDVAVKGWKID